MKEITRRVFALTLVLVMLLAMAAAVSAASVSWSDSEGGKTLTVTVTGVKTRKEIITNMPRFFHNYSTVTPTDYPCNVNLTTTATYDKSPVYQIYLVQAINETGLLTSYTFTQTIHFYNEIDANMPTGYYRLALVFDGRSGNWGICQGMIFGRSAVSPYSVGTIETGNITYAPTGDIHGFVFVAD